MTNERERTREIEERMARSCGKIDSRELRAAQKLRRFLQNPTERTPEERAPLLRLKNGRALMIERAVTGQTSDWAEPFVVSRHHGATCREIGRPQSFMALVRLVLKEGDAES